MYNIFCENVPKIVMIDPVLKWFLPNPMLSGMTHPSNATSNQLANKLQLFPDFSLELKK